MFQTDINPAARIGKGIFLDHATGLVVGETAVIEDDVSILHGVTLGGTGKAGGDRHPKIRHGVLIGAGAKILGNIEIGHCSQGRGRLGGAVAGAAQQDGGRRAGARRRRDRLRPAVAPDGPAAAVAGDGPRRQLRHLTAARHGCAASHPRRAVAAACPAEPACLYIAVAAMPEARSKPIHTPENDLEAGRNQESSTPISSARSRTRDEVKARPRKDDSAEVYVGDEFLGIVFKDEDDGDYNFSMAILDIDLA